MGFEVVPMPLPEDIAAATIEVCLWNAQEKETLRKHFAYAHYRFPLGMHPVADFLAAYRLFAQIPQLVGIANPRAATAHTAVWIQRLFEEDLAPVALECPPLHLWTGLLPVRAEPSWETFLEGQVTELWLRTVGYGQFGLPDLAHPLQDLRETAWIHSLFEGLFDWMYFEKRILKPGMGLEVPERGRFWVKTFSESGVLALWPYEDEAPLSSADAV
jgi:hypothetical protein